MMGSIRILPGTGEPNPLAPFGPSGGAASAAPRFTLTPVDYDPYALTPSGLIDVMQPFGLNDPARFDASAPDWAPFRSAAPAPATPMPIPAYGVAPGGDASVAPGWSPGLTPGSVSGLAPDPVSGLTPTRWGSPAALPPPASSAALSGVGDTMDQVEGGGPAAAGDTDFFGRPLDGRGLDDFKQVGRDVLNKAANGPLLNFAPRLGAAFDYAVGRAPTYDAALASRNADQAQADADMGPLAPTVEMAGGALLPWGVVSEGMEGLTLGRRLLAHTGIGGGMGAIYGVGASPDLTDLAQTLPSMARNGAMGAVFGMGLPYVAPLAAGLTRGAGRAAAGAADAFSGFGATLYDRGAPAGDGATGGAYTGRRYDPETGFYHDRARDYSASLDHLLRADPIGAQRGTNLDAYGETDPASLIDPWGSAVVNPPNIGFTSRLGQSNGDSASFIQIADKRPEGFEQQKEDEIRRISGFVTPSQPSDYLIPFPALTGSYGDSFRSGVPGDGGPVRGTSLFNGANFYVTPGGTTIAVPEGYIGVTARNGKGLVLLPSEQARHSNANIIRYGESSNLYPGGYFKYYNQYGQPLDPSTGKPGSHSVTHIPEGYRSPLLGYPGR